jgi:hypothetical protein
MWTYEGYKKKIKRGMRGDIIKLDASLWVPLM